MIEIFVDRDEAHLSLLDFLQQLSSPSLFSFQIIHFSIPLKSHTLTRTFGISEATEQTLSESSNRFWVQAIHSLVSSTKAIETPSSNEETSWRDEFYAPLASNSELIAALRQSFENVEKLSRIHSAVRFFPLSRLLNFAESQAQSEKQV
jgi:hypothetical protein